VPVIRLLLATTLALFLSGCGQSLHDLVANGDMEAVRAKIAKDPEAIRTVNSLGKTPLHYAVSNKRVEEMVALVEAGADVNAADKTGMTPLHLAAMLGRRDEATWLIEHGATLEPLDHFGDTPIHTAAIFGGGGVIQVLHQRGAKLDTKNNAGLTPLDLAKKHKQEKVVVFLEKLLAANGGGEAHGG
jgi:ankyrin repeat protein